MRSGACSAAASSFHFHVYFHVRARSPISNDRRTMATIMMMSATRALVSHFLCKLFRPFGSRAELDKLRSRSTVTRPLSRCLDEHGCLAIRSVSEPVCVCERVSSACHVARPASGRQIRLNLLAFLRINRPRWHFRPL